ncbi:uncharacterized protein LOC106081677 [Stomoxys calcitrans]|uniref:Uncharacterized protein n=1 Tax=Stomoxys calcitrans TaxID=35570 RepID=A0A1I8Q343_STOCA|nr:uncharacterized protein LOC106081677 [Stomoxys calcitrans]XP_013099278.1 uncharacterized protein LOC106081677 [Stomoxys calcitrans]
MADISTEQLTTEIHAVLKKADLSVVSAKKVREQVEKKLDCSLLNRKKEFDKIVMDFINSQQDDEESEEEEEDEKEESAASEEEASSEEEKKKPAKKRPQPTQRKAAPPKKKRKSLNASDSGTESDGGDDSDFEVSKKKKGSSAGPKKKKAAAGGAGRKSTGFTRAYNLSPELSSLMGAESLPRHEVVKKVWALIKERNLYDPNNKQYAICDDELLKVMKVKRFRTFGMLKHLKPHFLD